jgi:tetratricopeptide (TPR) repeat protein
VRALRRGVALAASIAFELVLTNTGLAAGAPAPQREAGAWERAVEAAANQNWPEAVTQFRLAVDADPESAVLRLKLGAALEGAGDAPGALEQYEEALRLDARLAQAHYGMGALLERVGRDDEAIERYTAALAVDSTFGAAHLKLADALRRTDRLERALSHYRRVIELEPATRRRTLTGPEVEDGRFGEAMTLVRLERYAEARDSLITAMRIHPNQPAFRHALARVFAAAPDDEVRDGARAWELVKVLPDGHEHPAVFETMAMALAELGHFDLAVDWQRLAMSAAARAGRPDVAQQMAASLARYLGRQPCRTPWRDDDPDHRPGPSVNLGHSDRSSR